MDTAFSCPTCGKRMNYTGLKAGDTGVCEHCGSEFEVGADSSSGDPVGRSTTSDAPDGAQESVSRKYSVLRLIAGVCRFAAWAGLIVGAIGLAAAFSAAKNVGGGLSIPVGYLWLAIPVVLSWFIFYQAVAEVILLFIDIEQNTREVVRSVAGIASRG